MKSSSLNDKNLKLIYTYTFISIFLYSFFGLLYSVYKNNYFRYPQLIAFIVFIYVVFQLLFSYINRKNTSKLISIFFAWLFFIIIRIKFYNTNELRLILYESIHLLSYLVPVAILLPIKMYILKYSFIYLTIFSILFLSINFFLIYKYPLNNLTDLIVISSLPPAGIVLLLANYTKKLLVILNVFVVISVLLIGLTYGRRSVCISSLLYLTSSFMLNVVVNKKIETSYRIIIFTLFTILCFATINYFIGTVDKNQFAIFDRVDTDSRSDVFKAFINDFKMIDYIIGRGIDGTYYNPIDYYTFDNEDSKFVKYRTNIESGFLYIIMKGGFIYLCLFLTFLFRAIYLGILKSNNLFTKALASYLIIYLIDMTTYGQPTFSIKYLLVWLCILLSSSKRFRNINEKDLAYAIKFNK